MRIRRLLVPTDFSAPARQATDYAARLAAELGAEIVLLFVEGLPVYGTGLDWLSAEAAERVLREQRRAVEANLARWQQRVRRRGVRCRALLVRGIPWQAIGDAAGRLRADWIVMATHGRTGLARAILGSVAENVVRTAPCPVLTLRSGSRGRRRSARRLEARETKRYREAELSER